MIAAGWLGWTEEVAMRTDVQYILAAYQGRVDILKAMFGSAESDKPKVSADQMKSFARTHNALLRAGKIGKRK